MRLDGQVAIVTGAAQGIGKAIALRLAQEGADIAMADINQQRAEATAAEIRAIGRRVHSARVDVSAPGEVQAFVAASIAQLGKIDILVNNAGIAKAQPFLEVTQENWDRHLKIHLFGAPTCYPDAIRIAGAVCPRRYRLFAASAPITNAAPVSSTGANRWPCRCPMAKVTTGIRFW